MQKEIKRKTMIKEINNDEILSPVPQVSKSSLTRHLRRAYALLTQKNHQNMDDKISSMKMRINVINR